MMVVVRPAARSHVATRPTVTPGRVPRLSICETTNRNLLLFVAGRGLFRNNDGAMGWSVGQFERWFFDYYPSDAGRHACSSCAYRRHITEFADDLYQDWFLSIKATVDAMSRDGRSLPAWLDDPESARRYVLRALDNDAVDIVRQRSRLPVSASARVDGTGSPLEEAADSRYADDGPLGMDAVIGAADAVTEARRALGLMLANGSGGCPGCTALMTVQLALGVLELLTDGSSSPEPSTLRGGTDEWDRTLYEALERVAPDRVGRVGGRVDSRTRQLKRRCGECARRLLGNLIGPLLGSSRSAGGTEDD